MYAISQMRNAAARSDAGIALALLLLAAAAPAQAQQVPLHQVPRPVLDAVRARFEGARIAGAETDRQGNGIVYEVAIRHRGRKIDVTVTPEGALVLIKREIPATDLPDAVASTLRDRYPGAAYQVVEAVVEVDGSEERLAYYVVDLVTAARRIEGVRVSPDGKVLGRDE